MKLTLMREWYCESRSLIDENNGSVGRSWIFFHHGIAPKVTSAAEMQLLFKGQSFPSSSLYFSYVVFIIQLLLSMELFHQSRLYLNNAHFHHPASTLQRTFSSIQVPLSQKICLHRSWID